MARDGEQRRGRNAKRWLWALLAVALALVALIAYTSLSAPDPRVRPSQATFPASDENANQL